MYKKKRSSRPRAITCHICGRGYGTASIAIHIPQCEALFVKRQAMLPRSERRPLPTRPFILPDKHNDRPLKNPNRLAALEPFGSKNFDVDKYNDAAFEAYNNEALVPCVNCGRTFLPKSLVVHQRSCTAEKSARPTSANLKLRQSRNSPKFCPKATISPRRERKSPSQVETAHRHHRCRPRADSELR